MYFTIFVEVNISSSLFLLYFYKYLKNVPYNIYNIDMKIFYGKYLNETS